MAPLARAVSNHHLQHQHHHTNGTPIPTNGVPPDPNADDTTSGHPPPYNPDLVSSSLLEPRIAVVLNVPKPWRPWLFACRLLSIGPAIFWALQPALTLLVQIIPVAVPGGKKAIPFPWTEMSLGLMWCGASAYLSFFFIDCLMSRWLINYTPQATIIRLLTINSTNAFLTERILTFSGGFEDPRLLLPGWVTIATTLTIAYHITQRSINIQKETSTSINIFSIASFISMISLLAHLHYNGSDYPEKPFESLARFILQQFERVTGEAILPSYAPSHSEL
ncbi:N-glycosylation protein-domain-containing protein [Colletotrichum acutatum]|uniref:N-glycosylation protein-domain-containing protein n=1 Tax=Glomerella acutata TaxID=27357 RepID=A0AAD9D1M3_GLOAC|nr:N-glycosylation protein-domain-containing protein [Colletotrichum acutatum]KAK1730060.1 N-glycosylation protein-domain-containing protein [Colletotrichum acutatum]